MKIIITCVLIMFLFNMCSPIYRSPYNTSYDVRVEQSEAYKRSKKRKKEYDKFHRKNNRKIDKLQKAEWWGDW